MKLLVLHEERSARLNPKIWDEGDNLHPEIREKLLKIAKDFQEKHYLPDEAIDDVILTGSLANYNWTEYSDIDLHIIADFSKIEDNLELLSDYYRVAKSLWNSGHEIEVCGHEVEIYVQRSDEEHHSTGVYSITNGEWLTKPKEDTSNKPDESAVQQKAEVIISKIDQIESMVEENNERALDEAEKLKEKIKKMRKSGLTTGGEYSLENMSFKHLRNKGHLDRLAGLIKSAYDSQRSVNCKTEPMESTQYKTAITETDEFDDTIISADGFDDDDDDELSITNGRINQKELLDAHQYLEKLRQDKEDAMSLDQKLSMVLDRSKEAYEMSSLAIRHTSDLKHMMKSRFNEIHDMLERIAGDRPLHDPDPPDAWIF